MRGQSTPVCEMDFATVCRSDESDFLFGIEPIGWLALVARSEQEKKRNDAHCGKQCSDDLCQSDQAGFHVAETIANSPAGASSVSAGAAKP